MSGNRFGRYIANFTIEAEVVKDETRDEKLTQHIPDMAVQQWTTLAGHLKASIAEVTKEAKQHLDQHQGDEFEKDHWGFWNLRRDKVEEWEETLRQKGQEAIENTFPAVENPPVYLTSAVVPLLDEENFTYTIRRREGEPGAQGVSISSQLRCTVEMNPVALVQRSGTESNSLKGSVPESSQFTADVSARTAIMNEGDKQSGFSHPHSQVQTENSQSVLFPTPDSQS